METMFRIYVEDKGDKMLAILARSLQNFTVTPATGFYKGVREQAAVVDVFETTKEVVNLVSQELARELNQELVVYVELPCNVIGATGTHSLLSGTCITNHDREPVPGWSEQL